MARKRNSDEDCLKILRQVKLDLAGGADVSKACRTAGRGSSEKLNRLDKWNFYLKAA
jgi:hypothetical protein